MTLKSLLGLSLCLILLPNTVLSFGMGGPGTCGTLCLAEMRSYCPTCYTQQVQAMTGQGMYFTGTVPWANASPWWWQTGGMNYSNFYQPSPWSYTPRYSGVMGNFYPGSGGMFGAKPNLYIEGTANTDVSVRVILKEEGSNWLASVPAHGALGWKGKLDNRNFLKTDRGDYRFIYYDFRMFGKQFQDQEGFCTQKENVIPRIAQTMNEAGFNGVEIADFLEYWSVKFPNSENYCVYPQDNRQLDTVLRLEITPKPASVQRLLFMVQVQDRLVKNGKKFTAPPKKEWHPMPSRALASDRNSAELKIREWGIGFFGALR